MPTLIAIRRCEHKVFWSELTGGGGQKRAISQVQSNRWSHSIGTLIRIHDSLFY